MQMIWHTINESCEKALVVGCGTSLERFDFESVRPLIDAGVRVIGANYAVLHCPCTDLFSAHPECQTNKKIFDLFTGIKWGYVDAEFGTAQANTPEKRLPPDPTWRYLLKQIVPDREITEQEWKDPSTMFSGNSGFSALLLALKLGAKEIGMIGMDIDGKGYFDPTWKTVNDAYTHVVHLTKRVQPYLPTIYYGSPAGTLPFERMTPQDVIKKMTP
jgi:hypothetical protein